MRSSRALSGTPTGSVDILDGSQTVCAAVPLTAFSAVAGAATCDLTDLAVGTHSMTASYGGSGVYDPKVSAPWSHVVAPDATTTTIASSTGATAPFSAPYHVTATVVPNSPGGGTPTGTVASPRAIRRPQLPTAAP